MPLSSTQVALLLMLVVALGFVWRTEGRGRWRSLLEHRLRYGVPWGTAVTVGVVVAFYLLAQGGARHWNEPLVLPFVSWSTLYPTGLLTSGIAHASPDHLVSNMAGTLALAPIVEYAWGHYPPSASRSRSDPDRSETVTDAVTGGSTGGVLTNPWVRAVVVFPAALLVTAFLTSLFALGPGLGFSGAVFAIAGFAVVTHPFPTLVGAIVASGLTTLYDAVSEPVVRATIEPGVPGPPSWAGIGFQAHLLGFLIGVLVGIALLSRRGRRPDTARVFVATVLLGLVQALWLITGGDGRDVFVLYRGTGVVLVLLLSMLVAVAAAGRDRPVLPPLSRSTGSWARARRRLALGWLGVAAVVFLVGLAAALASDTPFALTLGLAVLVSALLALPALPAALPDRWHSGPATRRQAAIGCLLVLTALVALPSVPFNLVVVDDGPVSGSGSESGDIEIRDYTVTYAENATSGQVPAVDLGDDDLFASQQSGVLVVNPDRQLWTVDVRPEVLEHEGNETVHVGAPGWREAVHVERTGWDVVGNESAYAVDLTVDGETTRSFASDPVRASAVVDGRTVEIAPSDDGFVLRVLRNGEQLGETPVPAVGETAAVGDLEFVTRAAVASDDGDGDTGDDGDGSAGDDGDDGGDTVRVFAETDGTSVQLAEREEYD